jgi:hypothetical protein
VVSEQIKTRTEVFLEEQGTRDVENAKEECGVVSRWRSIPPRGVT